MCALPGRDRFSKTAGRCALQCMGLLCCAVYLPLPCKLHREMGLKGIQHFSETVLPKSLRFWRYCIGVGQ